MLKNTGGTFAYIKIFKGYSAIASNYEEENTPSNTLICRVGNTLKLCTFFKKASLKKYLELSFHCICILLIFINKGIDTKEKKIVSKKNIILILYKYLSVKMYIN